MTKGGSSTPSGKKGSGGTTPNNSSSTPNTTSSAVLASIIGAVSSAPPEDPPDVVVPTRQVPAANTGVNSNSNKKSIPVEVVRSPTPTKNESPVNHMENSSSDSNSNSGPPNNNQQHNNGGGGNNATTGGKEKSVALTKRQKVELAWCERILDLLESHDDAWPFLQPVNTRQFPTYKKVIY